ncbi:efflux RND transporter periplasmic adaptor subunit [Sediminitomix flava]|uniref:Membrane fusion protein (Multidrug efflux system) n=1 Tax=Sediminitomix flava TaxID=379075 RepID=A0A315ZDC3_SEDFL|nr:efflux RND transporter periplasmic adaptor subunit [Sediminitomix flava]PWJ42858.1 membrane fusion protein (multidrug efflux system) [Sediminitomix flava]
MNKTNAIKGLTSIVVILFITISCNNKEQDYQAPVVSTIEAKSKDVEIFGNYVGLTRAFQEVEVRARVSGFLEKVAFKQGGKVKKGDLLYEIDERQYKAEVNRAIAQVKLDEAGAVKAERDLTRLKPLIEDNAVSQADFDNAVAADAYAKANVNKSKSDLALAQLDLSFTKITSPTDGYITESLVDLGTLVGTGGKSLLATVVKTDPMFVNFSMTALDYLSSKRRNMSEENGMDKDLIKEVVSITLADGSAYELKGDLNFAEQKIDPETGTYSVQAVFPNPDGVLLPGQATKVNILLAIMDEAVVVPQRTIQIEDGGPYIYVVKEDQTVEKRFVQLGEQVGSNTIIQKGIIAGEQVITEGVHKVRIGQKVAVRNNVYSKDKKEVSNE